MASHENSHASSLQPDLALVEKLARLHVYSLTIVSLIALVVLCAWLLPSVGPLLPTGWSKMKANTAASMLLSAVSLFLSQPQRSDRQLSGSRAAALLVLALAGSALFEHMTGVITGIGVLIADDPSPASPGLMSLQTAGFLSVLAVVLLLVPARKHVVSHIVDGLSLGLLVLTAVIFSGYCFGATKLFEQSIHTVTAPHTLICMGLLVLVTLGRRAEYGYFSVLIGIGIGSRIARNLLPVLMALPFLITGCAVLATQVQWLSASYAAALTAASISVIFFIVGLRTAIHANRLERDLRDLSLTDELTQTYNRRGFSLLGEQALREAKRSETPLTVLYMDLDGLKLVNDFLGHDAGSAFVAEIAAMLKSQFHGADIVARVGGDEFAIVMHGDMAQAHSALDQLSLTVAGRNADRSRRYQLAYSVGQAVFDTRSHETFSALVDRADARMYEEKKAKKDRAIDDSSAAALLV